MNEKIYKTTIGGREVSVQLGRYCGQANGSCFVTCGENGAPWARLFSTKCGL